MHLFVFVCILAKFCAVVQNAPQQSGEENLVSEVSEDKDRIMESDIFSLTFKAIKGKEELEKKANVVGFKKLKTIVIGFEDDNTQYPLTNAIDFNAGYSILANEELKFCALNKLPHLAEYDSEFPLLRDTEPGTVLNNAYCNYEIRYNISEYGEIAKEICKEDAPAVELMDCQTVEPNSESRWPDPLEVLAHAYPSCLAGLYLCDTLEICEMACVSGAVHNKDYFREETLPLGSVDGVKGFVSGAQFFGEEAHGYFVYLSLGQAYSMGTTYLDMANGISIAVNVYGNERCALSELPDDISMLDIVRDYEEPLTPFIPLIRCDTSDEITSEKISSNPLVAAACFDRERVLLSNCERIPEEEMPDNIQCDFAIHLYNVEEEDKGNFYCVVS